MQKKRNGRAVKVLGLLSAAIASLTLALSGQYVEAGGLIAAAFSSASVFSVED